MRAVTSAEMREIDRLTIEEFEIPGIVLMENAGLAVIRQVENMWSEVRNRRVVVMAGTGNNGGDGLVVARHLSNRGAKVKVFMIGDPEKLDGDAAVNYRCARNLGIEITRVTPQDSARLKFALSMADLIVDAVFGTGFRGELRTPHKELVPLINEAGTPVLAVDIPSGLADTGQPAEGAVKADWTVTFGLPKIGQLAYPGADQVGDLIIADIGFPRKLMRAPGTYRLTTAGMVRQLLPERGPTAHKGTFGSLIGVAGSQGMAGAACLAAAAALRAGAGLVRVATPTTIAGVVSTKLTEAMTIPLPDTTEGRVNEAGVAALRDYLPCDAIFAGPGLNRGPGVEHMVRYLAEERNEPIVFDADALNTFAAAETLPRFDASRPVVLTPHPGEMGRLLKWKTARVQANRLEAVQTLAQKCQAVVVLKGARTLIAGTDGRVYINPTGNPGMASGGMGDVLAGIIGAFLAAGMPAVDAAVAGVFVHGLAGDMAAARSGMDGLIAGDVVKYLPEALKRVRRAGEDWTGKIPFHPWQHAG